MRAHVHWPASTRKIDQSARTILCICTSRCHYHHFIPTPATVVKKPLLLWPPKPTNKLLTRTKELQVRNRLLENRTLMKCGEPSSMDLLAVHTGKHLSRQPSQILLKTLNPLRWLASKYETKPNRHTLIFVQVSIRLPCVLVDFWTITRCATPSWCPLSGSHVEPTLDKSTGKASSILRR